MTDETNIYTPPPGRLMGCEPRDFLPGAVAPLAGSETCPVVPRINWQTQPGVEAYQYAEEDQNGYNSCCLTSLAIAIELLLARTGLSRVRLDWLKVWKILARNRNVGVAIDTALQYILKSGFPILGSDEVVVPDECWDCENAEQFVSGIYNGCAGTYGRFMSGGGHAECAGYIKVVGEKVSARVPGSWGKSYGQNGWYDVPYSDIERGIPYFGAILIRTVKLRPDDTENIQDAEG